MALLTFKGGIHPDDGKSLAKDKAIVEVKPKGDLVYPVSQHIGAPANPVVAVGDHVLKGQMIAEAGGFVSAPIYASVSGTVKAIAPHLNPTGGRVNSIVIENDGEYKEVEYPEVTPLEDMSKEDILNAIGTAGVVGMGGAGFPTRVKLSPKEPEKIDYIIANCAECEPYITADYRTMIETPEKLVGGMKIILRLFDNAKGIFGVEDNKPDCIEKLKELTKDEPRIEVMALKTKYPQGGERQLIYATTGRAINSAMLPADAGCVVDNVATMVSVYQAVVEGKPSMERVVTVSGDAVAEPGNFRVPFGMNQQELVEAAGGFKTEPEKLISGGPMMGFAMFTVDVPVTAPTTVATESETKASFMFGIFPSLSTIPARDAVPTSVPMVSNISMIQNVMMSEIAVNHPILMKSLKSNLNSVVSAISLNCGTNEAVASDAKGFVPKNIASPTQ